MVLWMCFGVVCERPLRVHQTTWNPILSKTTNKKNVYGSLFIFFTIRIKSKQSQHFHIEDKIRLKLLCWLAMKDVSNELPQWIWKNLNPYIYWNPYILMFQFRAYCWTMISFGTNSKIHFRFSHIKNRLQWQLKKAQGALIQLNVFNVSVRTFRFLIP